MRGSTSRAATRSNDPISARRTSRTCGALTRSQGARADLAQMALAWTLRDPRVTSALIGASRPEQVIENAGALENLEFTTEDSPRSTRTPKKGTSTSGSDPSQDERP